MWQKSSPDRPKGAKLMKTMKLAARAITPQTGKPQMHWAMHHAWTMGVGTLYGLVLSFLAAVSPLAANAVTYTWYIGNDKGDFWSASNWDNGLPSGSD